MNRHRPYRTFWVGREVFQSPAERLDPEVWVGESEFVEVEPAPRSGWAHRPGAVIEHAETCADEAASLLAYAIDRYRRRHPEVEQRIRDELRAHLRHEIYLWMETLMRSRQLQRAKWLQALPAQGRASWYRW